MGQVEGRVKVGGQGREGQGLGVKIVVKVMGSWSGS